MLSQYKFGPGLEVGETLVDARYLVPEIFILRNYFPVT
jgi:hypothetical protein